MQGGISKPGTVKRLIKPFIVVTYELIMQLLLALPRYRMLNALKASFLRLLGARIGRRVVFYPGVWIAPGRNLTLGDDVDLAKDVLITTSGGVTIGDRTLIGYRTQILSNNHTIPPGRQPIFYSGSSGKPVHVGSDVWIGGNCMILPGVTIGDGAVVAGGSIVTRDVEAYSIVAGVPAELIRRRDE